MDFDKITRSPDRENDMDFDKITRSPDRENDMDFDKITKGRRVGYESKAHAGRGEVVHTYTKRTGQWVTIFDKDRGVAVTVRPSQVTR